MWNYRFVLDAEERSWSIREAYYSPDGRVVSVTTSPSDPFAANWDGTPEELRQDWELMGEAFNKPGLLLKDGRVEELSAGDAIRYSVGVDDPDSA